VAFVLLAATLLILWLGDRVVPLGKILADR
jgi:hypothetical protein